MAEPARNARLVTGLLLATILLPLIALAITFPELAGPPVAVFLLTGVAVFAYRRWGARRR